MRSFVNREWLYQLWNCLHVLQSLRYRIAGSGDPTKGLANVEEILHRSTGPGNDAPAGYRELMRLEIVDMFDLAIEACVDDVPDPCCSVRSPLLRNFFVKPPLGFLPVSGSRTMLSAKVALAVAPAQSG